MKRKYRTIQSTVAPSDGAVGKECQGGQPEGTGLVSGERGAQKLNCCWAEAPVHPVTSKRKRKRSCQVLLGWRLKGS